jgi:RimJ/RimL family protein N-acetyltransferase
MNLQTIIQNETIMLQPLAERHFEELYAAANDPLVWEQHPNPLRYQRDVFATYFDGAMQSKGAYAIINKQTNKIIGSSRFYDEDAATNSILIGYTFLNRESWGGKINPMVKQLMLDYIFAFVDNVLFHIGANNVRSQKAIERLGAKKIDELKVAYHGEPLQLNYVYRITKKDWQMLAKTVYN